MRKKNGLRTKIINELVDFFKNVLSPYMDKEFGKINERLDKVEYRLDKVEGNISGVKNELNEVKNRLSDLEVEVIEVKGSINELKTETPKKVEFKKQAETIKKLEKLHRAELSAFA